MRPALAVLALCLFEPLLAQYQRPSNRIIINNTLEIYVLHQSFILGTIHSHSTSRRRLISIMGNKSNSSTTNKEHANAVSATKWPHYCRKYSY
uniref:Secreted protein n=1 Tax=Heterorhabditis bacteriophora TaxID=37862 RepID=A0A1I7WLS6_HETBA